MFNHLRTLTVRQFNSLDDSIKLVVMHPNYTQQHIILGEFLDQNVIYVRFEGDALAPPALKEQLETALHLQNAGDEPLAAILLDECDRAAKGALDGLLMDLQKAMPATRIIIFSRSIPNCILEHPERRKSTAFIPHDPAFMLWDYAAMDDTTHLMEVHAFGEGRVLLNGQLIDHWDGGLPRSLFFYLVDRGMATRNEIFETFWPEMEAKEATNVFHVTKRKVSEVLGFDLTTYANSFYRISGNIQLNYDIIFFTEMLQNSAVSKDPKEARTQLKRAIGLYHGHFLYGTELEWAKKRRHELSQDYSDALISLAKLEEDDHQKDAALGLYLRAAAHNAQREDLTYNIMQIYRQRGMHDDAMNAFHRLSDALDNDLGMAPGQPLQELVAEIRHEMA